MIDQAIADLIRYALDTGLIAPEDRTWAENRLLAALGLDGWPPPAENVPLRKFWRSFRTGRRRITSSRRVKPKESFSIPN